MIVGERIPSLSRRIELSTLVRYAGASTDFNPIHYDESYARTAGLEGVIGHGMLAMGLVSEAVTDWIRDSGLVRSLSCRFVNSYRLHDVLTVTGEIVAMQAGVVELALSCVNQDGVEIIGRASATVTSPHEESEHDV
jgi:acyl dehydratase